jgi:hypothetical protein
MTPARRRIRIEYVYPPEATLFDVVAQMEAESHTGQITLHLNQGRILRITACENKGLVENVDKIASIPA